MLNRKNYRAAAVTLAAALLLTGVTGLSGCGKREEGAATAGGTVESAENSETGMTYAEGILGTLERDRESAGNGTSGSAGMSSEGTSGNEASSGMTGVSAEGTSDGQTGSGASVSTAAEQAANNGNAAAGEQGALVTPLRPAAETADTVAAVRGIILFFDSDSLTLATEDQIMTFDFSADLDTTGLADGIRAGTAVAATYGRIGEDVVLTKLEDRETKCTNRPLLAAAARVKAQFNITRQCGGDETGAFKALLLFPEAIKTEDGAVHLKEPSDFDAYLGQHTFFTDSLAAAVNACNLYTAEPVPYRDGEMIAIRTDGTKGPVIYVGSDEDGNYGVLGVTDIWKAE